MKYLKLIFIIFTLLLLFQSDLFATEYATFKSFYVESSYIGWMIAGVLALVAGAIIFFTGGTASPIVIGIGTAIGEMAGLSGIAATNYGLALLGGGSIASGGLGIAGGTALITVALTFSTEVVIDYSLGNVINSYSHSKFIKDSKKMATLPIPQNESGSDNYEQAIEKLKDSINKELPLSITYNQTILKNMINSFEATHSNTKALIKDNTFKSYLYFSTFKYKKAKLFANKAIVDARKYQLKRTLPAFIYATSSLYEKDFDFEKINKDYFRYAILAEPKNKLIPLLFAIYLDRIMYRMNDDMSLNYKTIDAVRNIAYEIINKDLQKQTLTLILMRYFMKIKIEQQKIIALSTSDNASIVRSPKTIHVIENSLHEYINLLNSIKQILNYGPMKDYLNDNHKLVDTLALNDEYIKSKIYLKGLVEKFKKRNAIANETAKPWYKFW